MTCVSGIRIFIGVIIMLCVVVGWFGSLGFSIYWWDTLRIDFPEMGSKFDFFQFIVFLNWALPSVFLIFIIISIFSDCCKPGNLLSSFFSGIGIISLIGGLVFNPWLIYKAKPSKCHDLMKDYNFSKLSQEKQDELNKWIENKISGMSQEDQNKYIEKFYGSMRCEDFHKIHWYFFAALLTSVALTIVLIPFYTCK